ncbi:MAG: cold shock domain-containing protein [Bacteroidota bacterium]|nr:cold shock domain-containing protein [Bacteroidota bacterium]
MGKSSETFNKKEKEKKRQKKQRDKVQKMEERKATVVKSKNFEDMLAYVDEHGNLTQTAPDPLKKKVFSLDDIHVSTQKKAKEETADINRKGKVTFYNVSKAYGFIKDLVSQDSIFVHANELKELIKENDEVEFQIKMGPKGPFAVNVVRTK